MRKITKLRHSIKAISPIISVLLLIAIAVVASLVVYAWVMGYIGGGTTKAGYAINIQSLSSATGSLTIYVQNTGIGAVQLNPTSAVYVNNTLETITSVTPTGDISQRNYHNSSGSNCSTRCSLGVKRTSYDQSSYNKRNIHDNYRHIHCRRNILFGFF